MIIFRNKGVIDPKSITTFGVSSKENPGAIGFFGTGLKYAIAILLREGCDITIHAGKRKLEFGIKRDRVRVDDFNVVTMNKRRLGFTTEVGKTWEVWQAFRELYCNTMDERGEVFEADEVPEVAADETVIVVQGEKFLDVWASRSDIILSSEPLERHEAVHGIHQQAHAQKAELEREFQERLNELGRDAQEQMSLAWPVLLNAADLPMEELGEWELDASYLEDHGCAFLSKREEEDARPSSGDLLQSMTASKH